MHLKEALERTQLKVFEDTARSQRPYLYAFLTGPVYLSSRAPDLPAPIDTCSDAWGMVKHSADAAPLKAFAKDFTECATEVRLVKLHLTTLERRLEPPPKPQPKDRINSNDGLRYIWIPPGTFQMGYSLGDTDCQPD